MGNVKGGPAIWRVSHNVKPTSRVMESAGFNVACLIVRHDSSFPPSRQPYSNYRKVVNSDFHFIRNFFLTLRCVEANGPDYACDKNQFQLYSSGLLYSPRNNERKKQFKLGLINYRKHVGELFHQLCVDSNNWIILRTVEIIMMVISKCYYLDHRG